MSQLLAQLSAGKKNLTRKQCLALCPKLVYDDGRTKQAFADETNIQKIMARADLAGTISHLQQYEAQYRDFSDFNFHEQTSMLTRGREIFDALPAEVRKEFSQSPSDFFKFVNDPVNSKEPDFNLPHLAKPGKQMASAKPLDADTEKAQSAAQQSPDVKPETTAPTPPAPPEAS